MSLFPKKDVISRVSRKKTWYLLWYEQKTRETCPAKKTWSLLYHEKRRDTFLFSWWVLQHCTGFARLVWGRLRVHRAFVYSDWLVCYVCFCSRDIFCFTKKHVIPFCDTPSRRSFPICNTSLFPYVIRLFLPICNMSIFPKKRRDISCITKEDVIPFRDTPSRRSFPICNTSLFPYVIRLFSHM